jgi:hypothetical protein
MEQSEARDALVADFGLSEAAAPSVLGPLFATVAEATPVYVDAHRCRQLRGWLAPGTGPPPWPDRFVFKIPVKDVWPRHAFVWLAEDPLPVDPGDPAARLRGLSWGVFWRCRRRTGPLAALGIGQATDQDELLTRPKPGARPGATLWAWYGPLGELAERRLPPGTPPDVARRLSRLGRPYYGLWVPLEQPFDPDVLSTGGRVAPEAVGDQAVRDQVAITRLFLALVLQHALKSGSHWVDFD